MLRYDTQSDFNSSSSWSSYGTSMNYYGGVFDGRYVYYVPLNNNGNVLRYDTQDNFASQEG
ncbi:hypothetical protein J4409_02005 [Candidatus Woesearchaeota archaeon]|nr:hypothetical protein [Candidatus Woesearchaeota archaeon]